MSRVLNIALPLSLLLTALLLSGCASKAEPEAAPIPVPAPFETKVEKPAPAPEVVAAPAVEQPKAAVKAEPAPIKKKMMRKKVVAKRAPPPPPPVVEAPKVVEPPAPVVKPEPAPSVVEAPLPAPVVAEPGFMEKYWMWLLGLLIIVAGVIAWKWKSKE